MLQDTLRIGGHVGRHIAPWQRLDDTRSWRNVAGYVACTAPKCQRTLSRTTGLLEFYFNRSHEIPRCAYANRKARIGSRVIGFIEQIVGVKLKRHS
jgi:hypothetical protein